MSGEIVSALAFFSLGLSLAGIAYAVIFLLHKYWE